jgi:hypothetical protein
MSQNDKIPARKRHKLLKVVLFPSFPPLHAVANSAGVRSASAEF